MVTNQQALEEDLAKMSTTTSIKYYVPSGYNVSSDYNRKVSYTQFINVKWCINALPEW